MSTQRVAVIFGGRSSEHSISCISAAAVWEALLSSGYEVVPVAITPQAQMVLFEGEPSDLRGQSLPVVDRGATSVVVSNDSRSSGLLVDGQIQKVDVVFPVLHGPWGEDGTIQGLLEMAGLPYVGSGVLASALCMDKITLKVLLRASGIAVADWVAINARSDMAQVLNRAQELGPAVFVKPSRAGSSVGITRVDVDTEGRAGIERAVRIAQEFDPRVIVEAGVVQAREIECGVRQDAAGVIESSKIAEIVVRDDFDFYDFNAKYVSNGAELVVPADVPEALADRIRDLARRCFIEIGCEGLARVDFFVRGEEIVVNEVNTMPGFTPISMYPRMWEASGMPYAELVDSLIREALARPNGLR
jgi:D-alanine-D-alanine ligase